MASLLIVDDERQLDRLVRGTSSSVTGATP